MRRPFGADSHDVSEVVADMHEWSAGQRRHGDTLGTLVDLALFMAYESPIPWEWVQATAFSARPQTLRAPREPRVTLSEAMARGWDGALFRDSQRWWHKPWLCWEGVVAYERMQIPTARWDTP